MLTFQSHMVSSPRSSVTAYQLCVLGQVTLSLLIEQEQYLTDGIMCMDTALGLEQINAL